MERDSTKTLFGQYAPTYLRQIDEMSDADKEAWLAHLHNSGKAPTTPRMLMREAMAIAVEMLGGGNRGPGGAALASARYFAWFATQSAENARTFFQGATKLLPVQLTGADGNALSVIVRLEGDGGLRNIEGALIDGQFIANPDAGLPAPREAEQVT